MEQMTQKWIETDDGRITVDVYGAPDAAAMIIIPGVMADSAAWATVAQRVTSAKTVAVVNRRGRDPSSAMTDDYSLDTEVRDARAVLNAFSDVQTLFGWSYGGLISLHLANAVAIDHVIAYEPIMAPFGADELEGLRAAHEAADWDRSLEIVLGEVTSMPDSAIEALRSNAAVWAGMRQLSRPVYDETRAMNESLSPREFATEAARIDLVIGEKNRGQAPYGRTFDDVLGLTPRAVVNQLSGQGHLAHLEAPEQLAGMIDDLCA